MQVLATAGHVDHGKSTLVRALTGTDPDRLAEEKRRGLTIELGYAWTELAGAGDVAFVDVPGHQRFLATTLAGIGPVPAVLLVVAADEGWGRQSGEHLAALSALGVEHGLVVITKSDRADPDGAAEEATRQLEGTTLAGSPSVSCSARTGEGMEELRTALADLVSGLPPARAGRLRLWTDRVFTIDGAGTVVTGTLPGGTVSVGDSLQLMSNRTVGVRALESLGRSRESATGVARVALNLRGVSAREIRRGDALLAPGEWDLSSQVDCRVVSGESTNRELVLHIGSAAVPVQVRPLSTTHVRLTLASPLPLEPGDRALLRDPGRQRVAAGLAVVDVAPSPFTRRGAARARALDLAARDALDPLEETARRGFSSRRELARIGALPQQNALPAGLLDIDGTVLTEAHAGALARQLERAVSPGLPKETARAALGLPSMAVLDAILARTGLTSNTTRISPSEIPPELEGALRSLEKRWSTNQLDAPDAEELRRLKLSGRELAQLAGAGHLTRLAGDVAIGPRGLAAAAAALQALPAGFTVSDARQRLGSSRRVVVPLLEALDRLQLTRRAADGRRTIVADTARCEP